MKKAPLSLFVLIVLSFAAAVPAYAQTATPTPKPKGAPAAKPASAAKPSAKPTPKPAATPATEMLNVAETWALVDKPDIRTLKLNSKLMGREMPYRVILPSGHDLMKAPTYSVIYLLHGLTGHYDNWTDKTRVGEYLMGSNAIIVTPEGGDGWYTDSISAPNDKYESYIIQELIPEIEKNFHVKTDRGNRVIAGLSMGGYGALKFGVKYPDKFVLAASFSGALGVTGFPATSAASFASIKSVFGEADSQVRKDNDLFRLFKETPADKLGQLPFIYVSCGTEDFLFSNNQDFMKILSEKKIKHEYRQLPGGHTWAFWDAQVVELLRLSDQLSNK